jgi:hypothetical protein
MSETEPVRPLRVLSLGWGVQSWALAAMTALGDQPPIDVAMHADTGHEKAGTYSHAAAWTPWLEEHGVRVLTVQPLDSRIYREDWGKNGGVMIPAYSRAPDGSAGTIRRQCTDDWKIAPLRREMTRELERRGLKKTSGAVELIQGISLDEWQRMRDSDVGYISHAYPLVDGRITRADCIAYLEAHGLEVPTKSACTFCPFHKREEWRQLKRAGGRDWQEAVDADNLLASLEDRPVTLYLHGTMLRLEDAVRIPEDDGNRQLSLDALCDGGYCGV